VPEEAAGSPVIERCCCELFLDEDGNTRTQTHACCPQHWREAEYEH